MTNWSFFFTIIGVLFITAQLFRLIGAIEQPRQTHPATGRKSAVFCRLTDLWRAHPWMFWKS